MEDLRYKIQNNFLNYIMESFMVERDEIELDKSLVDTGIIDSFGLIEICAYIEREFSFKIEEEQLTRENFGSVEKIVTFILKGIKA